MRIVLIGLGVVGRNFAQIIHERQAELTRRFGLRPQLVGVADHLGVAVESNGLDIPRILEAKSTRKSVAYMQGVGKRGVHMSELLDMVEADVMVEVTPTNIKTGNPGLNHIIEALKRRMHVITANKGPLALAMPSLLELARFNHVLLRFSGTVGGGTPVLAFAEKCLRTDTIESVRGILNSTTNYILTKMSLEQATFKEALTSAQKEGYAEADPSMDIDGLDTATKLVIIANWVMGRKVSLKDVAVKGIKDITRPEIDEATRQGQAIKLVGTINNDITVNPMRVSQEDPICVSGSLNAVTFKSRYSGEETIIGRGAGGVETASAILRDLLEIKEIVYPQRREW